MSILNNPAEPREAANYPAVTHTHYFKFLENSKILHQSPKWKTEQTIQPTDQQR
jgi:hypothetical protein